MAEVDISAVEKMSSTLAGNDDLPSTSGLTRSLLRASTIPASMPGITVAWNGERTLAVRLVSTGSSGANGTLAQQVAAAAFYESMSLALEQFELTRGVSEADLWDAKQ